MEILNDEFFEKAADEDNDPNVISVITDAILTDSEDDSARLVSLYQTASPENRALIDEFCISLCGFSFETCLKKVVSSKI